MPMIDLGDKSDDKPAEATPVKRWKARERRVKETPPEMYTASGTNSGKQAPHVHGLLTPVPGGLLVSFVKAETVRVAQYANVVIGPVGLSWVNGNVDMELLADMDWGADPDSLELTADQQREYDKALNSLRVTGILCEQVLAEDRESVERSIRQYNEREAAEQAAAKDGSEGDSDEKPKRAPRKRTASGRTRSRRSK